MAKFDENKMFQMLLDEVDETLASIEERAMKLESSTDQAKDLQILFRAAHNVKGAAHLYGLVDFSSFVHVLEDLLSALQKAKRPATARDVDVLLAGQGFLRAWIVGLRENKTHRPDDSAALKELQNHLSTLKEAQPQHADQQKTDATPATPAPASAAPAAAKAAPAVAPTSATPEASLAPALASPTPSPAAPGVAQAAPAPSSAPPAAVAPTSPPPPASGSKPPAAQAKPKGAGNHTVRIQSQKLDEIMQMIGELSTHQSILWHHYQNQTFNILNCKNAVTLNQKTLKDLYHLIITLRMQTAEDLFQRMERTARDVARELKKSVAIRVLGADNLLDKTVIELIKDPMMHIVRNAVDHGIESAEDRLKFGKPEAATLTIQCSHDGNQVIISIGDDGRGFDLPVILASAVKKGLVPAGQKLRDDEIIQLLFLPGFSTKEQVTHISGRGVGLDVVQKSIQAIGGKIDVQSQKGKGTTFNILLPASLEITDGLLIDVTGQTLIIPRRDVEEIIDLNEFKTESIGRDSRAIRMRKHLIPVENMADFVGLSEHGVRAPVERSPLKTDDQFADKDVALIIRLSDDSKLALRVDRIISQQQIVVRPIAESLGKLPGFSGMSILGNGEPAMIVSTASIGDGFLNWIRNDSTKDKESA